ncbi:MAG: T9SS type A sorting domain-containing protein [Bacteroidia bacterium]
MKKILSTLTILFLLQIGLFAQGNTFFTSPNSENIMQNVLMTADSGLYFCMQKDAKNTSLYWLKNGALSEVKNIGSNYAVVFSSNGTHGKQWFTKNNKALFVVKDQFTQGGSIWLTDGTSNGTDSVLAFAYGTNVSIAGMIGNDLYYSVINTTLNTTILYKTNFTKSGTVAVKTFNKTNLSFSYVDNGVAYLSGHYTVSPGAYYFIKYSFLTDTTRLIYGSTAISKAINGDLYTLSGNASQYSKKNMTTNVVTNIEYSTSYTSAEEILGVLKGKLFVKSNISLTAKDYRIYTADINPTSGKIRLVELKTSKGKTLIIHSGSFAFKFTDNLLYFTGVEDYGGGPVAIMATDGTDASTHPIQDLKTYAAWAFEQGVQFKSCGDRLYVYGEKYNVGDVLQTDFVLSSCDSTKGSLKRIKSEGLTSFSVREWENFQGKMIYTTAVGTNKMYAINACSAEPKPLGVKTIEQTNNVVIYPNPNNGSFHVAIENLNNNTILEVYNLLGDKVFSQNIIAKSTQINLSLNAGIYFVKMADENGKNTIHKILIQ